MMQVKDRAVVVTGAGGTGSGRAIALRFAHAGARVVASDVQDDGGRETVRLIEQNGGQGVFHHADVRVEEEVRSLIGFAEETFGPIAVLVNNASGPEFVPYDLDRWSDTIQTDLLGAMYATRFAIDSMRRGGGGAVINISSTSALGHGRKRAGGMPAYDAAKAGILRLTTSLAWLADKERIRINCLVPDWIARPDLKAYVDSLSPEQKLKQGVPKKLTTPAEIANAVLRLATDEALAGRVLVWQSDDEPRLIPWADAGYAALDGPFALT
jgi:NAD(P)-dependent dehydrogenase (short-subunit alcohol dehydrogenase family)